jgi:hypothetical protein
LYHRTALLRVTLCFMYSTHTCKVSACGTQSRLFNSYKCSHFCAF